MSIIDHKANTTSWYANSVAWVNAECLKDGRFPNGKVLTEKDKEECREQVRLGNEILKEYGCQLIEIKEGQLELNF